MTDTKPVEHPVLGEELHGVCTTCGHHVLAHYDRSHQDIGCTMCDVVVMKANHRCPNQCPWPAAVALFASFFTSGLLIGIGLS